MLHANPHYVSRSDAKRLTCNEVSEPDVLNAPSLLFVLLTTPLLSMTLALSACGGGGSAADVGAASADSTGRFTIASVASVGGNTSEAADGSQEATVSSLAGGMLLASSTADGLLTGVPTNASAEKSAVSTVPSPVTTTRTTKSVVVSTDATLYSTVPFGQSPPNGFSYLNNTFGKGRFVNGIDYTLSLSARPATFPNNSVLAWNWPDATSGSAFAYAYPEIIYGGTPYGNPYNAAGPWPQKVTSNSKLSVTYDIDLGGNTKSYDVLLDMYVTASPTSTDGSHVAEISFFPHSIDPSNLTGFHNFTWGRAAVARQGRQILIQPVTAANGPMDILKATIDMKEVMTYLISLGWISGNEYLRGAEFGVEVQVPNWYNSTPHAGTMTVNTLSYDWR